MSWRWGRSIQLHVREADVRQVKRCIVAKNAAPPADEVIE
jgi:hypothetical protein